MIKAVQIENISNGIIVSLIEDLRIHFDFKLLYCCSVYSYFVLATKKNCLNFI